MNNRRSSTICTDLLVIEVQWQFLYSLIYSKVHYLKGQMSAVEERAQEVNKCQLPAGDEPVEDSSMLPITMSSFCFDILIFTPDAMRLAWNGLNFIVYKTVQIIHKLYNILLMTLWLKLENNEIQRWFNRMIKNISTFFVFDTCPHSVSLILLLPQSVLSYFCKWFWKYVKKPGPF